MTTLPQALSRLQQYSQKVEGQNEVESTAPVVEESYAGRSDRSLQSLQRQLKEHEAALERVKLYYLSKSLSS